MRYGHDCALIDRRGEAGFILGRDFNNLEKKCGIRFTLPRQMGRKKKDPRISTIILFCHWQQHWFDGRSINLLWTFLASYCLNCSLRTADVSPRSLPLGDVSRGVPPRETSLNGDERGETSAVRRLSQLPFSSSFESLLHQTNIRDYAVIRTQAFSVAQNVPKWRQSVRRVRPV